jgi:hypothetical protein
MNPNASNSANAATHAALNQANQTKPEWLRVPDAVRIFGVCRSSLYELITSGAVKSTSLRKRCAAFGLSASTASRPTSRTPPAKREAPAMSEAAKEETFAGLLHERWGGAGLKAYEHPKTGPVFGCPLCHSGLVEISGQLARCGCGWEAKGSPDAVVKSALAAKAAKAAPAAGGGIHAGTLQRLARCGSLRVSQSSQRRADVCLSCMPRPRAARRG